MAGEMLDAYVQRLQNMEPFDIYGITAEGKLQPWYKVDGAIVRDLIIRETDLALQVQTVSAQIAHWARMMAQARRVWQIEERLYRAWRSTFALKAGEAEGKAPSQAKIEAMYRAHPDYEKFQKAVERAEEAFHSAEGIYEAFRAKRDMLRATVYRNRDDGSVALSV